MIFAAIVAGGSGKRMGTTEKPKQFLKIGGRPILIHTAEKFCIEDDIHQILVLCPKEWMSYTQKIIWQYLPAVSGKIHIVPGGASRNETILNAVDYIEQHYHNKEEHFLITHDAVRPFVSSRIIRENIRAAKKKLLATTALAATDTIIRSCSGQYIEEIPNRSEFFQCQTPQTFPAGKFKKDYGSLNGEEKALLTDAARIFLMKGDHIFIIPGERINFKITYPEDLELAELIAQKK